MVVLLVPTELGSAEGSVAGTLGSVASSGVALAVFWKMSTSCSNDSNCVGCNGLTGAFGLGFRSASQILVRLDAIMSVEEAPGSNIFSGTHTKVSVVRTARVDGM